MCEQSSAKKIIPTEDDFINSNIAGFGNDIGKITNRITSMYDVQSTYDKDSEEYKVLEYRICAGQLIQQDVIDKIKGIVAKPMPKAWYDRHAINDVDGDQKELYSKIVAERKPYFMRYIYPAISKEYSTYCKKANRNALKNFGRTLDELLGADDLSEEELSFLATYKAYLPLGAGDCVMNNICRMFEDRFDSVKMRRTEAPFDYTVMKSGTPYKPSEYKAIKQLYAEYNARLKNFTVFQKYEKEDEYEFVAKLTMLNDEFIRKCAEICPNDKARCDLILDMTYRSNLSKSFAWEMCGDIIIKNLMDKFGRKLSFPAKDDNGDIYFGGKRFKMVTVALEDTD